MLEKFIQAFKKRDKEKVKIVGKGLEPSPQDVRDYALSSTIPNVKRYPPVKPRPFDPRIHDQGFSPSCVGHAVSGLKEEREKLEKEHIDFDGEWLYKECKKIDGYDGPGTYFRTGLKVVKDKGLKPLDKDDDPAKYKIKAYARVDDLSFEGIKKALSVYHFLLAGFKGSNKGWEGEVIRPPKDGEDVWGHAVKLDGYDEDYLYATNSWGDYSWVHGGSGGHFKVPKDYMPFEAWAILIDQPNEVQSIADEIIGWVAKYYTKVVNGERVTTHSLNVREKPGIEQSIVKTLPKGTKIKTNGDEKKVGDYKWIPILK